MFSNCEACWYYDYDEETDTYSCRMDFDEDEWYRLTQRKSTQCPYFQGGDEYTVARRQ